MQISLQMHKALHEAIATRRSQAGEDMLGFYTAVHIPASWAPSGEKSAAYWTVTRHDGYAAISRTEGSFILYPAMGELEWE
jgi:hypothetical protein